MDNPLISIIIPVYNAGEHLKKCLDSVIHQTWRNLEILLIDDGSTDGSGDLCDEYAAGDKRITCLHQVAEFQRLVTRESGWRKEIIIISSTAMIT